MEFEDRDAAWSEMRRICAAGCTQPEAGRRVADGVARCRQPPVFRVRLIADDPTEL
jgi:hypothetical protein